MRKIFMFALAALFLATVPLATKVQAIDGSAYCSSCDTEYYAAVAACDDDMGCVWDAQAARSACQGERCIYLYKDSPTDR